MPGLSKTIIHNKNNLYIKVGDFVRVLESSELWTWHENKIGKITQISLTARAQSFVSEEIIEIIQCPQYLKSPQI